MVDKNPQFHTRAGRFTTSKKKQFIAALAETANVSKAAEAVGIDRSVPYAHKKTDKEFAEAWEYALEEAGDLLEAEARRRAVEGVDRPIYQKGELVGYERQYSDRLLLRLLEAHKPEKFKHRQETKVVDDPLQNILDHIDGQSVSPEGPGNQQDTENGG